MCNVDFQTQKINLMIISLFVLITGDNSVQSIAKASKEKIVSSFLNNSKVQIGSQDQLKL